MTTRVKAIDAGRGAAMVGVMLSHSAQLLPQRSDSDLGEIVVTVGMIATPAFLLMAGVLCGFQSTLPERRLSELRIRLLDRALFLLIIGHLAFGLTHAMWLDVDAALLRSVYITDAVAVALLLASALAGRVTRNQLLALGLLLLLISFATLPAHPRYASWEYTLERIFTGMSDLRHYRDGWVVPIIPYIGLFLVGMAGGVEYGHHRARNQDQRAVADFCIKLGAGCMAIAVATMCAWLVLRHYVDGGMRQVIHLFVNPQQKIPLSPVYVLSFGGAAILMVGVLLRQSLYTAGEFLSNRLATLGRASIFVFLLQYWLISVPTLRFDVQVGALGWAAWLAATIAIAWLLASLWNHFGGQRLLTIGLRHLAKSRTETAAFETIDPDAHQHTR